ncbi:hypothetical protein D3C73_1102500 [compost metagenome]
MHRGQPLIEIRAVLTLIAPLHVHGQARLERQQILIRQGQASRQAAPEQPAAKPADTERLVTGQHIGIDKHGSHYNTHSGKQREHVGESFAVDHHHRVATLCIARTGAQVQLFQGFAQLLFDGEGDGLGIRLAPGRPWITD